MSIKKDQHYEDCPQQRNGIDCGLYCILNAERLCTPEVVQGLNKSGLSLRERYLTRFIQLGFRCIHDIALKEMIYEPWKDYRVKRGRCEDDSDSESTLPRKHRRSEM